MSIKLDCIRVGMLETNCDMVYDEFLKEAIITDPGDNAGFIEECAKEINICEKIFEIKENRVGDLKKRANQIAHFFVIYQIT